MSSNSNTKLCTQQSIKAYVDAQVTAQDLDVISDSGTIDIDLDSEIDAPITLILDIVGISDSDTSFFYAEPKLRYPDNYDGVDTTYIMMFSDTMLVTGSNFEDVYLLDSPISSLFSKDEIDGG